MAASALTKSSVLLEERREFGGCMERANAALRIVARLKRAVFANEGSPAEVLLCQAKIVRAESQHYIPFAVKITTLLSRLGTWGGSINSLNVNLKHGMNYTRVCVSANKKEAWNRVRLDSFYDSEFKESEIIAS